MSAFFSSMFKSSSSASGNSGSKLPPFQLTISLEQRRKMSTKMMTENPGRIPVILTRAARAAADTPMLKKSRLLVPGDLTVGQMLQKIRQDCLLFVDQGESSGGAKSNGQQALFLFVGKGVLPPIAATLEQIHARFKDEDGFLYITYSAESTFGCE